MPSHRADRRAVIWRRADASATPRPRRRPSRTARRSLRAASLPGLAGVAVLVVAAVGTLTGSASQTGTAGLAAVAGIDGSATRATLPAQASALTGAAHLHATRSLQARRRAVSRDASRLVARDDAVQALRSTTRRRAAQRDTALAGLETDARRRSARIAAHTWGLPVQRGVYHLTSRFGECSGLWSHCHTGLDFAAPSGTPIHAVAGGTVTEVGYAGAYGNRTIIRLHDGSFMWYCHQTAYSVAVGQQVAVGEVIGSVGATGNVTGPHVHLEVRPTEDHPVDPFAALVAHHVQP